MLMGTNYALMGIGFSLVFGVLGIVNFAHGTFVVLTMYLTLVLFNSAGLDPLVGTVVVTPMMVVFSVIVYWGLIGRFRMRMNETGMMLLTLGVSLLLESVLVFMFGTDIVSVKVRYDTTAFNLGPARVNVARLLGGVLSVVTIAALSLFLRTTTFGKMIRASANDSVGALLVGIDVERVYLGAFAISVATAAIAGSALSTFSVMTPYDGMHFMLYGFIVAVLGTLGSIPGALVAGLTVGLLETFTTVWLGARWTDAVTFSLLIAVLIYRPGGLLQSRAA
ncbi:MAG: branched-chain amino acid ABC transporter permease [Candidatus Rokubacteria bacterium]|nr:branched-chain amino acid ABC transporter permease [Candidatus Rokubacteria bacterium]